MLAYLKLTEILRDVEDFPMIWVYIKYVYTYILKNNNNQYHDITTLWVV